MQKLSVVTTVLSLIAVTIAQTPPLTTMNKPSSLPPGYWPLERTQPIIEKTQPLRLAPELSHLSQGEQKAIAKLLEVGKIFQSLYEQQRHPEALTSFQQLAQLGRRNGSAPEVQNLLTLYRLNQGPIATTL